VTRAILFDMDGTLLRLDVDIEEARLALAAKFGPLGVTRPFRPILRRIRESAAEAAAAGKGDRAALEREGLAILDRFEVAAAERARVRDGAVEIIMALAARHIALGLVTDNGRACVAPALRSAGIDPSLFTSATRDDVPAPKPDPAGVVQVARALGASSAWYIGDHPKDVEAGRAARAVVPGLHVAALTGGLATREELTAAGADVVLDDLRRVLTLPGI
jgi:phosphoglycolate phosphatase